MTTETTTGTVRSADGTTIAYDRVGTGPALVTVDPAGCFRAFGPMRGLATALAPHFTVYSYDRRGRGGSGDTLPYAVDREVEDLRAVIDAAGGPAYVYGFSSGAVLALHAAAGGLPITRMVLLEPPVSLDGDLPADGSDLGAEVAALVAAGRRGDAVIHFQTSIGVPDEMVAGIRRSPAWPELEKLAHTLVYDTVVTGSMTAARLAQVDTPTLVLSSVASDDRLRGWAEGVAAALPNGEHRAMAGEWHGVSDEDLLGALTEYLGR